MSCLLGNSGSIWLTTQPTHFALAATASAINSSILSASKSALTPALTGELVRGNGGPAGPK